MIKSKDETIIDLQEKKKILEQFKIEATEESKKITEEVENYRKEIDELRNQLTTARIENDKNNDVIKTLTNLTAKYEGYPEENQKLKSENAEFKRKFDELETQINLLNEKSENRAARHADDMELLRGTLNIEHKNALIELNTEHQKKLQKQADAYSVKINDYEDKVKFLLERLETNQATTPKTSATSSRSKKPSSKKYTDTEPETEGKE